MEVTHIFGAADPFTHTKANANFADLTGILSGNLKGANIHPDAGIVATQLADRYSINEVRILLVPFDSGPVAPGSYAAPTFYTMPNALTVIDRYEIIAKGQGFLYGFHIYVKNVTVGGGGNWPTLEVRKNGATIGQTFVLDADDKSIKFHANDPVVNPFLTLANGDYFEFLLGQQAADTAQAAGVSVNLFEKWRLVN